MDVYDNDIILYQRSAQQHFEQREYQCPLILTNTDSLYAVLLKIILKKKKHNFLFLKLCPQD